METPELFEFQYSLNSDKNLAALQRFDSLIGSNPLSLPGLEPSTLAARSGDNWMLQQAANWFNTLDLQLESHSTPSSATSFQLSPTSNTDPLTGTSPDQPVVGAHPEFAIKTGGTFTMNGSGDLDGNPLDPTDDAKVYAAIGFTINGHPILPVQRDIWATSSKTLAANRY